MQNFGLVYKDVFVNLGLSATETSIILNMNQAFGMLLALLNGPLLRLYGYRKISILSSLLYSFGVIFTSFSTTFIEFLLFYGIMACKYVLLFIKYFILFLLIF